MSSGFHHFHPNNRPPCRQYQSAGKHEVFPPTMETDPGSWTQGRGPGTCKAETIAFFAAPAAPPPPQSIPSICWVTHHHADPIARVPSHSIPIVNRLLMPALRWSGRSGPIPAGFVSVGQAKEFDPSPYFVHECPLISTTADAAG